MNVERMAWNQRAIVDGVLAGQVHQPGHLPGAVIQGGRPGGTRADMPHLLARENILTKDPERSPIIVALWRDVIMFALGDDRSVRGIVREPLFLAVRGIAGQGPAGGVGQTVHISGLKSSIIAGQAETQAGERRQRRFYEWLKEQPAGELFVVVEIRVVAETRIADPIENPGGITDRAAPQISMQLEADIPVRDESGRQATLVEDRVGVGL